MLVALRSATLHHRLGVTRRHEEEESRVSVLTYEKAFWCGTAG